MREIKFRAWDKLNQVMGDVLQYIPYAGESGTIKIDINSGVAYMSHDFELMQFTGLHDKNGKEIYEGDIIEFEYDDGGYLSSGQKVKKEVSWQTTYGAGWRFGCSDKDGMKRWSYPFPECEVIGNIYENYELLETGNT